MQTEYTCCDEFWNLITNPIHSSPQKLKLKKLEALGWVKFVFLFVWMLCKNQMNRLVKFRTRKRKCRPFFPGKKNNILKRVLCKQIFLLEFHASYWKTENRPKLANEISIKGKPKNKCSNSYVVHKKDLHGLQTELWMGE